MKLLSIGKVDDLKLEEDYVLYIFAIPIPMIQVA
jgi:hypothetical protein